MSVPLRTEYATLTGASLDKPSTLQPALATERASQIQYVRLRK